MPNLDRPVTASLMIDLGNLPLRTWTSIHVVHVEPPFSGLCRISKEATGRQKDRLQGDLPCKNEGESEGEDEGDTACYCVRAGCGKYEFCPAAQRYHWKDIWTQVGRGRGRGGGWTEGQGQGLSGRCSRNPSQLPAPTCLKLRSSSHASLDSASRIPHSASPHPPLSQIPIPYTLTVRISAASTDLDLDLQRAIEFPRRIANRHRAVPRDIWEPCPILDGAHVAIGHRTASTSDAASQPSLPPFHLVVSLTAVSMLRHA